LVVETIRYFVDGENDNDPFDDESFIERFPSSLLRETGFFLVPAARTWDKMLSFSSELFRRVVTTIGAVPAKAILNQRDQVRMPEVKIEEEPEIKELFNSVNNELSLLFNKAPSSILRLTGTNSESILSTLIPHFIGHEDDIPIPAIRQGSGIVSMQNLLLLLQLGRLRKERNQNFLVAIEEPELHIPPSQQRRLTNRLKACCQQTIVTTHSPDIASEFEPHSIRVLENQMGTLMVRPLMETKPKPDDSNPVRQLIQWQKREAVNSLMHERLLIPEGKGDYNWLNLLTKGIEIDYDYSKENSIQFSGSIGIFPTDSASVEKIFELLSKAHSNVFCLVDGDKAGKEYIKNLKQLTSVPKRILMWPHNFVIEDIICHILKSDADTFLPSIHALIEDDSITSIDEFNTLLKLKHRNNNGGRKDDYLLHEELIKLIFTSENGKKAASKLIEAILDATSENPSTYSFVKDVDLSDTNVDVYIYQI
jgi:putative ATP-dependent endonuclease of OLD family